MFSLSELFAYTCAYLLGLFLLASKADRGHFPSAWLRHPLTYTLSLGVYATSWSYYGSVGFAATGGFSFLTIYLGVTLAFALSPILLAPVLTLVREYQLSSIADLYAFRYGGVVCGIAVTLFMLIGILPYLALQIRAMTQSMQVLTEQAPSPWLALTICLILIAFSILFGARHLASREKHKGLVAAMAFESAFKLLALLGAGGVAIWGVFGGFQPMLDWSAAHPEQLQKLYAPVNQGSWPALIFLSFCAAFLLPRQFHMLFHENLNPKALKTASWAFPLYLLLLNLPIVPLLWAGQVGAVTGFHEDYLPLGISLHHGGTTLTLLTFLGGISAASGMVIVTTLALASMCMNYLVLPWHMHRPINNPQHNQLYPTLLRTRRVLAAMILLSAYGFYLILEHNEGLAQLGLVSFVAIAQFFPGFIGILFWPRATSQGFLAGLGGGAIVWFLLLILPIIPTGDASILQFGLYFSNLNDPWSHATFWTLFFNGGLFVLVSLITQARLDEAEAAQLCVRRETRSLAGQVVTAASPEQFRQQLAQVLGDTAARGEVNRALSEVGLDQFESRPAELRLLRERIERNLSGLLGPITARLIVDDRLMLKRRTELALSDSLRLLEGHLERSRSELRGVVRELDLLRRYHRDILQALPIGVCALDAKGQITLWNAAMSHITDIHSDSAQGSYLPALPAPWRSTLQQFAHGQAATRTTRLNWNNQERSFMLARATVADPTSAGATYTSAAVAYGQVLLLEDRTDIEQLELELAHRERLASVGRFAAGVAHEIGNPLTGIDSLAQNLKYDNDPDAVAQSAEAIRQQTKRIDRIVKSLLGMSHNGESRLDNTNLQPHLALTIFEEAVRWVYLGLPSAHIDIDMRIPETLVVCVDRQSFIQVLINLIENAIDACGVSGKIHISTKNIDNKILFYISDNGPGIKDEIKQKIFEPFFTTKSVGQGTGLGLALVHRILTQHGGDIRALPNLPCGTQMEVSLPGPKDTDRPMGEHG